MCILLFHFYFQGVYLYYYYLQYYSFEFKNFLLNISEEKNYLINENQKLKDKLKAYKNENLELKNKINKLISDNEKLSNDFLKAKKIISSFNNTPKIQENNNMINNLNELIKVKDNLINDLRLQLQNSGKNKTPVNFEDIMVVNFISLDQKINCGIKCLKTETFVEVEERLYQQYEKYIETNNNFITKGRLVLRFKKIFENNIINGDKIQLIIIE